METDAPKPWRLAAALTVAASLVVLSGLTGVAMTQTLAGSGYVKNKKKLGGFELQTSGGVAAHGAK